MGEWGRREEQGRNAATKFWYPQYLYDTDDKLVTLECSVTNIFFQIYYQGIFTASQNRHFTTHVGAPPDF